MRYLISLFALAASLRAQTTVSLRAGGPGGFVVVDYSGTNPASIHTTTAHGLAVNDKVIVWGLGASVSSVCASANLNGINLVSTVPDSTHFTLKTTGGTAIVANGAWCSGGSGTGYNENAKGGGKLTDLTLQSQPRVWLDGPTGTMTRQLALGTGNGLTSLVVASNVATVTTSYAHGISVGDKVGVWGSSTSAINGTKTVATVADSTHFTYSQTASNGTYSGVNNTCGAASNADCLRISQRAYDGNIWWDNMNNNHLNSWASPSVTWKHVFDGGSFNSGQTFPLYWANAAIASIVDPSNAQWRTIAKYCVNNAERASGVNWSGNELVGQFGNVGFNDFASTAVLGYSMCYIAARDYLSSGEKQAFADKMLNDVDWLNGSACNKSHTLPSQETLVSGTAQAGSSTTITLAAGDSAANSFYVNNVIQAFASGPSQSFGLVTAYNSTTKVATVSSWSNGNPTTGTAYKIYATATASSTGAYTTGVTITGVNSHFLTDFAVGDAIIGGNFPWYESFAPFSAESYVTAIANDTSMTVTNADGVTISTSTPTAFWIAKKWATGDCSIRFAQAHWSGNMGSLPSLYQSGGGSDAVSNGDPVLGGNNGFTQSAAWIALDLALADDDSRAVADLAMRQEIFWDWQGRHSWQYDTGFGTSGGNYTPKRNQTDGPMAQWAIANSVPSFPSMDPTGPWMYGGALMKMYGTYPDRQSDGSNQIPRPVKYGSENDQDAVTSNSQYSAPWQLMGIFRTAPTSDISKYFLSYAQSYCCVFNQASGRYSDMESFMAWIGLLNSDPRIPSSDYTVQPRQYLFQATSNAASCVQTGNDCTASFRGDGMISMSGAWSDRTATHLMFEARTVYGQHDSLGSGQVRLYKAGHLLNSDYAIPGGGSQSANSFEIDMVPKLGTGSALNSLHGDNGGDHLPATADMIRWSSANHGSWSSAYGDSSSNYAYSLGDLTGMYRQTYNRIWRHVAHLKKSGTEELVIQFDDFDTSNHPTLIESHLHYDQTGENVPSVEAYNEGTTSCPGSGGCASLDTNRTILSLEDGSTDAVNPARNYGLITKFFTVGSAEVRSDGTAYSGGNGHTHRVSLCGGSCGSTSATGLEALSVHKISSNYLTDTTLTASALNPDSNWTGVQTTDKVAMFSRGGVTRTSLGVTTTHSGTAQYLIAGMTPGTYSVTRNGSAVSGSPFTVAASDNTIYFEAASGTIAVAASSGGASANVIKILGSVRSSNGVSIRIADLINNLFWSTLSDLQWTTLTNAQWTGIGN